MLLSLPPTTMSLIALRGIVKKNEEDRKWVWRGIWTFGKLPEDEEAALNAKNPSVRPFSYSWQEARLASNVLVPSANKEEGKQEEERDEETEDESKTAANAETKASTTDSKPVGTSSNEPTPMQVDESSGSKKEEESKEGAAEMKDDTETKKPAEPKDGPVDKPEIKEDSEKKGEKVTFATTEADEPPFTDASIKNPEKCPPGGAWNGYFETAAVSDPFVHRKRLPLLLIAVVSLIFSTFTLSRTRALLKF